MPASLIFFQTFKGSGGPIDRNYQQNNFILFFGSKVVVAVFLPPLRMAIRLVGPSDDIYRDGFADRHCKLS